MDASATIMGIFFGWVIAPVVYFVGAAALHPMWRRTPWSYEGKCREFNRTGVWPK